LLKRPSDKVRGAEDRRAVVLAQRQQIGVPADADGDRARDSPASNHNEARHERDLPGGSQPRCDQPAPVPALAAVGRRPGAEGTRALAAGGASVLRAGQHPWDESAVVVDEAAVLLCRRRGAAIDLVLDRAQLARSQFVFTQARGRPAVWWQTQKTVQAANPGARVPRGRAAGPLTVAVDTREKYGWKFAGRPVTLERRALIARR